MQPSKPWNLPSLVRKHVVVRMILIWLLTASSTCAGSVLSNSVSWKLRVAASSAGSSRSVWVAYPGILEARGVVVADRLADQPFQPAPASVSGVG